MAKHETHVRLESRKGMVQVEYRVICSCGWQDKAATELEAETEGKHHSRIQRERRFNS